MNFAALQRVVQRLDQTADLVVNRPGPTTVVNDMRASGALVAVTGVRGSVWPIGGKAATLLEGIGQRVEGSVEVFVSSGALQVANDDTSQPGDQVTHEGRVYEIRLQHDWSRAPFFHYSAVLVS